MVSFRYGAGGESGLTVRGRENNACAGSVQRRQRRRVSVEKKARSVGKGWGSGKSIFELSLRNSFLRETTTPPPRPKQTFSLPKLKIPTSPKLPTGRPSIDAPNAWAASSMTRMLLPRTSSTIALMSAGLPKRCGTIMTLVFSVSAKATVLALMLRSSPTSARTGSAPTAKMGDTTLVQQKVGTTTSSSARTSQARKAISRAKLPDPQSRASSTPSLSITADLSLLRSGPSITFPDKSDRRTPR